MPSAIRSYTDLPGWFDEVDAALFRGFLGAQAGGEAGCLVELGGYLGRSAAVIGEFVRPADRFVVVDLFGETGDLAPQEASVRQEADAYSALTRERFDTTLSRTRFEANYLALHDRLPTIVQDRTSEILAHVPPGGARFVHVDASHLYPHVRIDVRNTREMLRPGGVAAFDDFRGQHTPGVAAAVWEGVFTSGLVPIALTAAKFYGVFAGAEPARAAVSAVLAEHRWLWHEVQDVAGHPVFRVARRS